LDCPHFDAPIRVEGSCYYCTKLVAHLLTSADGTNGHHGSLTREQERFVGLEDERETGRWNYTRVPVPDLLSQLLAMEPAQPWDRTVPLNWGK
jgi:hypothetical protein